MKTQKKKKIPDCEVSSFIVLNIVLMLKFNYLLHKRVHTVIYLFKKKRIEINIMVRHLERCENFLHKYLFALTKKIIK